MQALQADSTPAPTKPHASTHSLQCTWPTETGCTVPLPPALLGKMQTGTLQSTSAEVGPPTPTSCLPPPHHHLAPRLTKLQPQGLRPTGNRSQEEAAVCRHRRGNPHAPGCTGPKNPRGSPPVAPQAEKVAQRSVSCGGRCQHSPHSDSGQERRRGPYCPITGSAAPCHKPGLLGHVPLPL